MRDCCFAAQGLLDEVHRSHAAHVVGVAYKLSAWGVQADFAAVASHSAAIGLASFRLSWFVFVALTVRGIVIDAVVVLAQHGQVRRFRVPAVVVGINVVDLAPISGHIAVRPRTHEVLRHSQRAKFVGREPCLIKIDRAGGGVEKPDVELVTKGAGHRSVDEFSAGHGRAVG